MNDLNSTTLSALFYFHFMNRMAGSRARTWVVLTRVDWGRIFEHALDVYNENKFVLAADIWRRHWEDAGKPSLHPYVGYLELERLSVGPALRRWRQENSPASMLTISEKFKYVFKSLMLRNGEDFESDYKTLVEHWAYLGSLKSELDAISSAIIFAMEAELPEKVLEVILP